MSKPFKHIVLIGRPGVEGVPETLIAVKNYLQSQHVEVIVEQNTASCMQDQDITAVSSDNIPNHCDLMMVVGGDGSLINAAHTAMQYDLPMLGIHRGRLGFLTDVPPDELDKIGDVLKGNYQEEVRFLLHAKVYDGNQCIKEMDALNEVALIPGDAAHMIEFETDVNMRFVCKQRADGLIVATPTGSTAYALSAGGPILHPKLDAIVLVPMFPHTLSSRPIVVEGNADIDISVCDSNDITPYVSADGLNRTAVKPGSRITIKKSKYTLRLIHPQDYTYFATLRGKLGWEQAATRI